MVEQQLATLFHLCAVCIKTHIQFGMGLLFSELIHTQQEVELFGPAFSRSCIFSRPYIAYSTPTDRKAYPLTRLST